MSARLPGGRETSSSSSNQPDQRTPVEADVVSAASPGVSPGRATRHRRPRGPTLAAGLDGRMQFPTAVLQKPERSTHRTVLGHRAVAARGGTPQPTVTLVGDRLVAPPGDVPVLWLTGIAARRPIVPG